MKRTHEAFDVDFEKTQSDPMSQTTFRKASVVANPIHQFKKPRLNYVPMASQ